MGVTRCCVSPLPSPPSSPLDHTSPKASLPTRTHLAPRNVEMRSSSRMNKYMLGMACTMIISLEMGDYESNSTRRYSMASSELAKESQLLSPSNTNKQLTRVTQWSEKRICPPWHLNSLETIVPENLPRPSAHRKWEGVIFSLKLAPPITTTSSIMTAKTNCFSL